MAVGLFCGLRRVEISSLVISNITVRDGVRVLRLYVAKTGQEAVHPLLPQVEDLLSDYLDTRVEDVEAPLFATHGRDGKMRGPLAPREVDRIIRRWALSAGLTTACERGEKHRHAGRLCHGRRPGISPHVLRATYATLLAEAGVPVQKIQHALRWASVQQAVGYVAAVRELREHPVWALRELGLGAAPPDA
jgi:integrase